MTSIISNITPSQQSGHGGENVVVVRLVQRGHQTALLPSCNLFQSPRHPWHRLGQLEQPSQPQCLLPHQPICARGFVFRVQRYLTQAMIARGSNHQFIRHCSDGCVDTSVGLTPQDPLPPSVQILSEIFAFYCYDASHK